MENGETVDFSVVIADMSNHPGFATMQDRKWKTVVCCLTGFINADVKEELVQKVHQLHGIVSTELTPAVTHVVSPVNTRTHTSISALVSRKWVVGPEWVHQSVLLGTWTSEIYFGRHGNRVDPSIHQKHLSMTRTFLDFERSGDANNRAYFQMVHDVLVKYGEVVVLKEPDFSQIDQIILCATEVEVKELQTQFAHHHGHESFAELTADMVRDGQEMNTQILTFPSLLDTIQPISFEVDKMEVATENESIANEVAGVEFASDVVTTATVSGGKRKSRESHNADSVAQATDFDVDHGRV